MPPPRAEEVFGDPTDRVARHIRRYVASNGEKGHRAYGHDALLLTTLAALARIASPEERPALWERVAGEIPEYAACRRRTRRALPVVIVEPA